MQEPAGAREATQATPASQATPTRAHATSPCGWRRNRNISQTPTTVQMASVRRSEPLSPLP